MFDTLAKERVFEDAQAKLGRPLDIFIVNSYGSAAQSVVVLAMLPLLASLRGISLRQLPDYLLQGDSSSASGVKVTSSAICSKCKFCTTSSIHSCC